MMSEKKRWVVDVAVCQPTMWTYHESFDTKEEAQDRLNLLLETIWKRETPLVKMSQVWINIDHIVSLWIHDRDEEPEKEDVKRWCLTLFASSSYTKVNVFREFYLTRAEIKERRREIEEQMRAGKPVQFGRIYFVPSHILSLKVYDLDEPREMDERSDEDDWARYRAIMETRC